MAEKSTTFKQPLSSVAARSSLVKNEKLVTALILAMALLVTSLGSYVVGATAYGLYVIALIGGATFFVVTFIRPEYGLYVLVASIYLNLSSILSDNYGIPDLNKALVVIVITGLFARLIYLSNSPLIFNITEVLLVIFGFSVILSVIFAQTQTDGGLSAIAEDYSRMGVIVDYLKDFIIFLIIVQIIRQESSFKNLIWLLIVLATMLSIFSIFQYITGNYQYTFFGLASIPEQVTEEGGIRSGGPVADPNFYAMFLLMILPSAVYRVIDEARLDRRLLAIFASVIILVAVLLTYSRGSTLAILGTAILMILSSGKHRGSILFVATIFIGILLMLAPSNVWSRISSIGELLNFDPRAGFSSDEFSGRYSEAAVAIEMFYDYPLLGIGKEQYPTHYLAYSSRLGIDTRLEERQTHNLYLEIMAEQGLVGLTTFGLAMFMIFRKIQVAKNHLKQKYRLDLYPWLLGVEYGLVTYLLASLFLHGAFIRYFWLMVGVTITGINLALMAKSKADQERDSSLMG